MSNKGNRKLTDINHVRGLAKRMAYEFKTDIDIVKRSRAGIGECFDIIQTSKNKGAKVETVNYIAKVEKLESKEAFAKVEEDVIDEKTVDVRDDSSADVLQDFGDEPVQPIAKKSTKKRSTKK
jgi:hypothetical protein